MENFEFLGSEKVYNIVSKAILRSDILENVSKHEGTGRKLYTDLIEQRFRGEKSVWEPMQKCNLKTFQYMNNVVKTKVQEKVIELKEGKSLISRYLKASRKRLNIDIQFHVGNSSNLVLSRKYYSDQIGKL